MSGEPTLTEVLALAVRDGVAKVRTTVPAVVTDYDPDTQTVSARIAIRSRYKTRDGEIKSVAGPTVTNIPVLFPYSKAGYGITFPLAAGDWVTLHIAERSISDWKATGNTDVTAGDLRRFDLSDAFAYPGGQPPSSPASGAHVDASAMVIAGDDIRMGSASASDFVALSSKVDAALNLIRTVLTTWIVAPGDGGAALKLAAIAALTPANTGASKVKAE